MEKADLILAELAKISERQQKDAERVRRIERKMLGDKEYRIKGSIEIQEEHAQFIAEHSEYIKKIPMHDKYIQGAKLERAKFLGIGIGSGVAGGGFFTWIKHLFGA